MPENERFNGLFDRLLAADGGDLDWNVTGECCIAAIFLAREEREGRREKGVEEFVFLFFFFFGVLYGGCCRKGVLIGVNG